MPRYVVYEVWTKSRIIEAANVHEAYEVGAPEPQGVKDFNLCNWHVVNIEEESEHEGIH